jgi:pancreatic triacylglycerol lipase
MNVVIFLLVLLPLAFTGPVQPVRRYFREENNPDFKRFIYVENEKGDVEMIDLKVGDAKPRVELSDVSYDLYTKNNKDYPYIITTGNVNELSKSFFDPKKPILFVAHGWNNNRNSDVNRYIREATFGNHDVNLFIVDWSGPANSLYLSAKGSVGPVGKLIGNFINEIQKAYNIDGSSFVLIGHSLGAHVVGSAGATVNNKVAHIIGLDPAGPLFSLNHPEERLDISDAKFVQVIHTNGALLGFGSSIGNVDYFPNGGMTQPGCGFDLAGTCAHSKAYKYLAESLTRGPVFQAVLCSDYSQYEKGLCANNEPSTMGDININSRIFGDYYLDTNADSPYGQG